MAQSKFAAATAEVALTAITPRTVLQLVAGAHPIAVTRWGVFFDGTSGSAEPVQVEVARQTGAGTSSAGPINKLRPSDGVTLAATSRITFVVEPSKNEILDIIQCHPQSGYDAALAQDDWIIIPANGRLGIICEAPANVNVRAKFQATELQNEAIGGDPLSVRDALTINPTLGYSVTTWAYDITAPNDPTTLGYNRNVENTGKRQIVDEVINGVTYRTILKFNGGDEPLEFSGPTVV